MRALRGRLVYGVLPALTLVVALLTGWLKWHTSMISDVEVARAQSIHAASDTTIAMLSYRPDTVETQLNAAEDRLTGDLRQSYGTLVDEAVIPGAKQQAISAVAAVPAAAAISVTRDHAVILLFVDQTTTVGSDPPTSTASSVKVTLEKVGTRWLVSDFTPE